MISRTIIYVLAVVTMAMAQNPTICDEVQQGTFIPNVRNCSAWFRCGPNGPEQGFCEPQFLFNPIGRFCDWPVNVNCFQCPRDQTLSTHSISDSCRSFVRCLGGTPTQLMCVNTLQFNSNTGQCDVEAAVQCTLHRCPPTLPDDGSVVAIRDAFDCSVYHMCVGDPVPVRMQCENGLHFDLTTSLCTLPAMTDCSSNLQTL